MVHVCYSALQYGSFTGAVLNTIICLSYRHDCPSFNAEWFTIGLLDKPIIGSNNAFNDQ